MDKDAKFYESVLRRIENEDDIKVVNVRVCEACGKGENFVSNVQRVFIDGLKNSSQNYPVKKLNIIQSALNLCGVKKKRFFHISCAYNVSVIAKIKSKSLMAQKFHFDEVFQNEVEAYEYILPALKRHSKSKLLSPECLYLSHDLIILEDLSRLGCKSMPKGHRFSLNESLIVLKESAKLHAASFSLQEREPARLKELKKLITEIYRNDKNEVLENSMRAQIRNAVLVFEDEGHENQRVITNLKNIEKSGYKQICDIFMSDRKLSVFNHGDTWGSNILFRGNTVRLVDFQMMRFTSVAADLSYFLYINLRPSDRRANLDKLLTGYLEELRMHLRENGVSEELMAQLTMAWLKSELKDFKLFGFLCAIFLLPVFYFEPGNIDVNKEVEYTDFSLMTDEHKSALREYVLDFLSDLD